MRKILPFLIISAFTSPFLVSAAVTIKPMGGAVATSSSSSAPLRLASARSASTISQSLNRAATTPTTGVARTASIGKYLGISSSTIKPGSSIITSSGKPSVNMADYVTQDQYTYLENIVNQLNQSMLLPEDYYTIPETDILLGDKQDLLTAGDGIIITGNVIAAAVPQGPIGDTGPQGPAGTVAVGTVATGAPGTSAIVQNTGTPSAAVLNFTIPKGADGAAGPSGAQGPKGDKGDTGEQGLVGPQGPGGEGSVGPAGPQGPAGNNGASAYEVAVSQGFVGSVGDWLLSLIGADGQNGATGATGAAGAPGATGATGPAGETGPAGPAIKLRVDNGWLQMKYFDPDVMETPQEAALGWMDVIEITALGPDISGKANMVAGATVNNLAALNAQGDLLDSGKKPADFATAAQGTKADNSVQLTGDQTVAGIKTFSSIPIIPTATLP